MNNLIESLLSEKKSISN